MEGTWRKRLQKVLVLLVVMGIALYLVMVGNLAQNGGARQWSDEVRKVFSGEGGDNTALIKRDTQTQQQQQLLRREAVVEREMFKDVEVVFWGDSIVRQMYGSMVGYFNRTPPELEVEREKRHNNFTFTLDFLNLRLSYRFVDFMQNLVGVVDSLDCGCHNTHNNDNNENKESKWVFYIISVGLWDLLWHDTPTFTSSTLAAQQALQTVATRCFECRRSETESATQHPQQQLPHAAVILRGMTPVDEEKLPSHKKVMTNEKIRTYNQHIKTLAQHVRKHIEDTTTPATTTTATTPAPPPFQIRFFDSFDFYTREGLLESPDGVHFLPTAVQRDTMEMLATLRAIQDEAAGVLPPTIFEDFLENVKGQKQPSLPLLATRQDADASTDESRKGSSTTATTATTNVTKKAAAEPKRGGDPCYEVGCLAVYQLALIFLFSLAWVAVACLKLWQRRRTIGALFRVGGSSGVVVGGDEVGGGGDKDAVLPSDPMSNKDKDREREKKGDDSTLVSLR